MSNKHFIKIDEPTEIITDIASSYRRQNILSQKIRSLYTPFDGIKIGNWQYQNTLLPFIKACSIVEFDGEIYEATKDIIITDNTSNASLDRRWFELEKYSLEGNYYLDVKIVQSSSFKSMPIYDYNRRGFYTGVKKALRINFRYDYNSKQYVAKNVFDINDTERYGSAQLKKVAIYTSPGEFIFNFPPNANAIEISLIAAGAGGGGINGSNGHNATDGTPSQIFIGNKLVCTCYGGKLGKNGVGNGTMYGQGGDGGKGILGSGFEAIGQTWEGGKGETGTANNSAPAQGGIVQGNVITNGGGFGGKGGTWTGCNSGGGGSGASALITITRDMLDSTKQIKIVIGTGGLGNTHGYGAVVGTNGKNGSCNIVYYERTVSA